jgi:hypothetical protein
MSKVSLNDKYNLKTAYFWAMFATKPDQQQLHCPTVTLYQNQEGDFFAVERSPNVNMEPTSADLIEDPREWLNEHVNKWLNPNLAK